MKDFQQILRICWFSSIEINSDYNTSSSSPSSPHPLLPLWLTSHSIPYNFFYLFLFSIFYEISSIGIMKIISKFYFSVSSQNHQLFLHCLWQSLILITIISIFKSLKIYYCERIAIQSRYKLTNYLHYHLIGKHGICYFLQYENKNKIDNPDQRITQDIDKLTQEISTFLMNVISIPAILLFYSIYLWLTIGFFAPMMCYLYFIIGSLCSYFQAKRLVPLVYEQEKLEGNFRAGHVNYQTHLPSITLLRGEKDEEFRLQRNFSFLVKIASDIMKQELYLNLIVNWFSYFGSIVNYAVIGASVLYFSQLSNSSESDLASSLAAGSYACLYLISGLTTLLSTYESLSKIAALSSRVVELIEVTSLSRQRSEKVNQQGINRHFDEPQEQELELVSHSQDISIQSTSHVTNSPLIHVTKHTFTLPCRGIRCDVNFALTKGMRLLLNGPSGIGKTTLIKALAGVSSHVNTSLKMIHFLSPEEMMFVPQEPYYQFSGDLKELVCYPFYHLYVNSLEQDRKFSSALQLSGIEYLRDRFAHSISTDSIEETSLMDSQRWCSCCSRRTNSLDSASHMPLLADSFPSKSLLNDHHHTFSGGEAQRISWARIFYSRPKLLFLDEATSALDELSERFLHQNLLETIPDVTLISIGHNLSLLRYHTHLLTVHDDGSWSLCTINEH